VTTVDRRKMSLAFKCTVIDVTSSNNNGANSRTLLDFRLSRGDGLEFKRHFVRLKESLTSLEMESSGPPIEWVVGGAAAAAVAMVTADIA
jgi:hypothetical protein